MTDTEIVNAIDSKVRGGVSGDYLVGYVQALLERRKPVYAYTIPYNITPPYIVTVGGTTDCMSTAGTGYSSAHLRKGAPPVTLTGGGK